MAAEINRKLYRIDEGKVIAGVCSGLGEYLNVDPVVLRICAVLGIFVSCGWVCLFYFLCILVIPKAPGMIKESNDVHYSDPE